MEKFLNRQDVAKLIAADLKIPATHVHKIMGAVEDEIAKNLKIKGRVKFQGFGTFYLVQRKSRTLKQINTGSSRILLEHQMIKFVGAPALKRKLMSQTFSREKFFDKIREKGLPASETVEKLKVDKTEPPKKQTGNRFPQKSANFKPIKLKPLRIHQRLTRAEFDKILRQKLLNLAQKLGEKPKSPAAQSDPTPEERVLIALIKRTEKEGAEPLEFSISSNDLVTVRTGKPRRNLANLPKTTVAEILSRFFEINDLGITHERFVKLSINSKIITDRWIQVFSLPTNNGASVYVRVYKKAEGD